MSTRTFPARPPASRIASPAWGVVNGEDHDVCELGNRGDATALSPRTNLLGELGGLGWVA